ncbi:MAG: hypothetical protein FJY56_19935 [Betaproteobacteria bacterium]|nr:hypothetical protein [Betaproteobacteria bacterium]
MAGTAGAVGGIAQISVFDRVENRPLPVYTHNGRHYVVGKPGNEYQIRVQNRARQEILSVVSVDGVNAVSGETANWNQTGYVLGAHQGFDIRGWRKSMDRIAAFYFTEHHNSYAARSGRPHNVGVIGVALFRKKYEPPVRIEPPRPLPPLRPNSPMPRQESPLPHSQDSAPGAAMESELSAAPAAPSASARDRADYSGEMARALPRSSTLGTGHGRSETSRVTYTHFERASATPAEVITIYYDTYENLLAQGVIPHAPVYARPGPTPFPGQFVPDPR